ncbi:hypothetical protein HDV05_003776 [Chytridiales sp. JEL 0842]|nr:hypothetical protein HDV05_003776 [Chytridiales sp. JEL 0842]
MNTDIHATAPTPSLPIPPNTTSTGAVPPIIITPENNNSFLLQSSTSMPTNLPSHLPPPPIDTNAAVVKSESSEGKTAPSGDPAAVSTVAGDVAGQPSVPTSSHPTQHRRKSTSESGERRFVCTFAGCTAAFFQMAHLKIHQRRHTGERPFVCSYCDKSFNQKGNLKTHERKHTGDRPYKCEFPGCNKVFTQLGNLRTHEKLHLNTKKYHCTYCLKTFSQQGNLKSHIAKVHEKPASEQRAPSRGRRKMSAEPLSTSLESTPATNLADGRALYAARSMPAGNLMPSPLTPPSEWSPEHEDHDVDMMMEDEEEEQSEMEGAGRGRSARGGSRGRAVGKGRKGKGAAVAAGDEDELQFKLEDDFGHSSGRGGSSTSGGVGLGLGLGVSTTTGGRVTRSNRRNSISKTAAPNLASLSLNAKSSSSASHSSSHSRHRSVRQYTSSAKSKNNAHGAPTTPNGTNLANTLSLPSTSTFNPLTSKSWSPASNFGRSRNNGTNEGVIFPFDYDHYDDDDDLDDDDLDDDLLDDDLDLDDDDEDFEEEGMDRSLAYGFGRFNNNHNRSSSSSSMGREWQQHQHQGGLSSSSYASSSTSFSTHFPHLSTSYTSQPSPFPSSTSEPAQPMNDEEAALVLASVGRMNIVPTLTSPVLGLTSRSPGGSTTPPHSTSSFGQQSATRIVKPFQPVYTPPSSSVGRNFPVGGNGRGVDREVVIMSQFVEAVRRKA